MQIKLAICEDDTIICKKIKQQITKLRPDYRIDTYPAGEILLNISISYDILFLDIEMPGKDGMSIAKELRDNGFKGHIIFLSSHTEFMPDAFKVKAFRFLSKPVDTENLLETLNEAEAEILMDKQIIINTYGADYIIHLPEILYIQADKNKTILYALHETIETNYTLKYWEDQLGYRDFFQPHKSYIISLKHVKSVHTTHVILHDTDIKIPVSRRKYYALKNAFFDYVRDHATYM